MPKPPRKKDVIFPVRYLADTKSPTHRYHVAQSLDCEAMDIGLDALVSMGHTRGPSIYLQPYREERDPKAPPPCFPLERRLSAEMRLYFGSRPPIFEDKEAYPKIRKASFHELEYALNDAWRPFFERKRRDVLRVARDVEALLSPKFADRSDIVFGKREGSVYQRLGGSDRNLPREPRTCGFVLNKSDFHHGASLTSLFAMDGLAFLILSRLIAERHPSWLDEPGFRMVEMIGTPIPDSFESLDFVDDWGLESLVHIP
jgi:hypothetical protein